MVGIIIVVLYTGIYTECKLQPTYPYWDIILEQTYPYCDMVFFCWQVGTQTVNEWPVAHYSTIIFIIIHEQ